jgi:hypothetical protein
MQVVTIKILISNCTSGIYLRWWYNGWHYYNFTNGYEIQMNSENIDTQVTRMFSRISKIERPTKLKAEYSYQVILEGITAKNIPGFTGLLLAEKVEQYESGTWREVDITRGDHIIKDENSPGYILNFEITRKELPLKSSVYQKSQKLYLGNILCDLDDNEVIAQTKQTNNIAEMQDRQSDFTAQFKIRKTRAMKALFELSGEVGIDTNFPYENQQCKLIQDGIEIITGGQMILDRVDDQYYYVSILSGNQNFFKSIESFKITDLTLASTNHTWNVATMVITHAVDIDYVYPLCEPSDDGGISPLTDDGDRIEMYGGWIWPFVKVKAIWDEIFSNAGYSCEGDILTNPIFLKLFMPIVNLKITDTKKYLYSASWNGYANYDSLVPFGWPGAVLINGDWNFQYGHYYAPYTATYKFHIHVSEGTIASPDVTIYLYSGMASVGTFTLQSKSWLDTTAEYEIEYTAAAGEHLTFWVDTHYPFYAYIISVTEIRDAKIDYLSYVVCKNHLPDISQVEFIKMICNMFGLIPEVTARDKKIKFWNYEDLYKNIAVARDWSAYLSERDDEMEFKFGDYAQNNYLRYKESDDVIKDQGRGIMQVNDETLEFEKEVIELPVSTCDEVAVMPTNFSVNISRINFNKWNSKTSLYDQEDSIDPRIVYVDFTKETTGPLYQKTFGIRPTVAPGGATDVTTPKKASSLEASFSYLVTNYAALSRMLTKTNLRRAKFNLPVYEVAGLKHYVPIYLSQYKAYFYVNGINNYVPGQLCTIDLIKL